MGANFCFLTMSLPWVDRGESTTFDCQNNDCNGAFMKCDDSSGCLFNCNQCHNASLFINNRVAGTANIHCNTSNDACHGLKVYTVARNTIVSCTAQSVCQHGRFHVGSVWRHIPFDDTLTQSVGGGSVTLNGAYWSPSGSEVLQIDGYALSALAHSQVLCEGNIASCTVIAGAGNVDAARHLQMQCNSSSADCRLECKDGTGCQCAKLDCVQLGNANCDCYAGSNCDDVQVIRDGTTSNPALCPTAPPTASPSTVEPTHFPTAGPTANPTPGPTEQLSFPTAHPTVSPSRDPTYDPTSNPSLSPSVPPTASSTNSANFTVSVTVNGDSILNDTKIVLIITETLGIGDDDILSTNIIGNTMVITLAVPADRGLDKEVIGESIKEGLVNEFGHDADITVTVTSSDDGGPHHLDESLFSNFTILLLSIVVMVLLVIICILAATLYSRRSHKVSTLVLQNELQSSVRVSTQRPTNAEMEIMHRIRSESLENEKTADHVVPGSTGSSLSPTDSESELDGEGATSALTIPTKGQHSPSGDDDMDDLYQRAEDVLITAGDTATLGDPNADTVGSVESDSERGVDGMYSSGTGTIRTEPV